MSRQREDLSKQQNLSVFFSPKMESQRTLRNEWDGSQDRRQQLQSSTASNMPFSKNQKIFRKRVLPQSIESTDSDVPTISETAIKRHSEAVYPKSSAYGVAKAMTSIGGVSFVAPGGDHNQRQTKQ